MKKEGIRRGWWLVVLLLLAMQMLGPEAAAVTCTATSAGTWSSKYTWDCGTKTNNGPPAAGDDVVIKKNVTVDVQPNNIGNLSITAGDVLSSAGAYILNLSGNLTVDGTISAPSSTIQLGGNSQWSGGATGSAITLAAIDLNFNALTFASASSYIIQLQGATPLLNSGSLNNDAANSAVTFYLNRAGSQSFALYNANFPNLRLGGSGTKTSAASSLVVLGDLTIDSGTTFDASAATGGVTLGGNLTITGALSGAAVAGAGWTFNGAATQTITGAVSFYNLTLNNSQGLVLGSGNLTVGNGSSGSLVFQSGVITTGTNALVMPTKCDTPNFSGVGSGGWVNGNVRLTFPNYGVTCVYPVGSANAYAPITLTFPWFSGITGGTLTGSSTAGVHPKISTSGINYLAGVSRYWTLGATGDTLTSLPAGGSYNTTLQFVPGDIQGGAAVSSFVASRYTSNAWTSPVLSLSGYTANTVSVSGQTSFGSFVTGQAGTANPGQCPVPSFVPSGVTCYCDNFAGSNLTSAIFNSKWTVSSLGPTTFTPAFVNGSLRLTDNNNNEATSATLGAIFPAAGNYISVEFRQYAYNGSGADGIAVTLSDYSVSPNPGAFGGSLGYAQKTGIVGFAGGWLGVGFDEYGNYTNPTEGRIDGPGFFPEVVAVRGSYAPGSPLYSAGYPYLGKSATLSGNFTIDNRSSTTASRGYYYQVIIDARGYTSTNKTALIQVNRDSSCSTDFCASGAYSNLLSPFDAYKPGFTPTTAQVDVPANWLLSFTGSTGGSTNIHEISGLRVCAQSIIPPTGTVASGFNAIDSAMANTPINVQQVGAHIYTKLVGVDFALNIAVLNSGGTAVDSTYAATSNKNVTVELIDNSTAANQSAACAAKASFTSTSMTFSSTDKGFKLSPTFNVASAYSNVLVRIKDSTTTACSSDVFAIRPLSFPVVSAAVGTTSLVASSNGATASTMVKAGSNFTLSVTASPSSNYRGTASITAANVSDAVGVVSPAPLSCSFAAADSSGTSSGTCQYGEVGYFSLATDAVVDSTFTTLDQTHSDCVAGSTSNVLNSSGQYGCNIGSPTATSWGRFIPDHFDTAISANACGIFTYSGQFFPATVSAKNLGGAVTTNYAGAYAKTGTFSDANSAVGAFSPAVLAPADFVSGVANWSTVPKLSFTYSTKTSGPSTLKLRVVDTDGVTSAAGSEGTTPLRSGLLKLVTAYGSELLPLTVAMETRYWNGSGFILNTDDSCTSLAASNISAVLVPGSSGPALSAPAVTGISKGRGSLVYPTPKVRATYRICADISSDPTCVATTSASALSYLTGRWDGSVNYDRDPSARAAFGLNRGAYLYYRESY